MPAPYGVTPTGFSAKSLEEILTEIADQQRATISPILDTSTSSPLGQINGIKASQLREVWEVGQVGYDGFNIAAASGEALTQLCALTGTDRKPATRSLATCDLVIVNGVYAAGTLVAHVSGDPTALFENRDEITVTVGSFSGAVFQAQSTGPVQALAGTLTVIANPVAGWTSITNTADADLGSDEESDVALRARQAIEIRLGGASNPDALTAVVSTVDGVQSVQTLENDGDAVDANGLSPHSMEVLVFDGVVPSAVNDEIAQAIWSRKPGGIKMNGTTSGNASDAQGATRVVNFSRVTVKDIWLEFDINVNSVQYQSNDEGVKQAVADYGDQNQSIGKDVIVAEQSVPVFSVPGVVDITEIRLGFAASPVGTSNLVIDVREIADMDTSRIVVNATAV